MYGSEADHTNHSKEWICGGDRCAERTDYLRFRLQMEFHDFQELVTETVKIDNYAK